MASTRKKQDEKNLKILRDLGSLPQNKYCFDCNQRGPTYVNVTIGSFVCTKCSGMLRGLTPPHRVKSISMATFTQEEIDLLRNRGNDYCRRVWLGLYEGTLQSHTADEQNVRDFMVDKYERKRYFMEPGSGKASNASTVTPLTQLVSDPKPIKLNGFNSATNGVSSSNRNGRNAGHRNRPEVKNTVNVNGFADFEKADIFTANTTNNNAQSAVLENGFANFDDNPVFSNVAPTTTTNSSDADFSIFDLTFTSCGPVYNDTQLFPRCNTNRWSLPATLNSWTTQQNNINTALNSALPVEDKYAALKDLDNEMKSQTAFDWSSSASGSNGSLYSSPTPTGSVYSSQSPQGSMFGSPSQSQIFSAFPATPETNTNVSNPFSSNTATNWNANNGSSNGVSNQQAFFQNPFKDLSKTNGFSNVFPQIPAPVVNGLSNGWPANPFKVNNVASVNSNNPFL